MIIPYADFIQEVKTYYIENPCKLSCIAFWKLEQILQQSDTYKIVKDGHIYLYAIKQDQLQFYWSDDRERFLLRPEEIGGLSFLVLHHDFYVLISGDLEYGSILQESHPLIYDPACQLRVDPHAKFSPDDFDFGHEQDFMDAAELINGCYENHRHTAEEIHEWSELPVFDESLWIWIRERASRKTVGLGISTYQESIRETYLDWIQVLPAYQGNSLGTMLVHETINRSRDKSEIIRVTGVADGFYRTCGFKGREIWQIIKKA